MEHWWRRAESLPRARRTTYARGPLGYAANSSRWQLLRRLEPFRSESERPQRNMVLPIDDGGWPEHGPDQHEAENPSARTFDSRPSCRRHFGHIRLRSAKDSSLDVDPADQLQV